MKYACLVYVEEAAMAALSPEEGVRLVDDSLDYDTELARSGNFLLGQALQAPASAVTLRVRNGRMSSTDGPFAETKEHLAGFVLIEARDFNEAIRLAAGIPMARVGSIEVRPFLDLQHS
jgi:hypothetical protein